jgi:glucokinase
MRELLIDAILDLSGDEYESKEDIIELAKESEAQLIDRIIAVACFYRDQFNEVTN